MSAVESSVPGYTVGVSGYNDKLALLLEEILSRMKSFTVRKDRFAVVQEKFEQFCLNWDKQQPCVWCKRMASELLQVGALHGVHDLPALQ
jgi:secreted Zn-dependent insulinase-like peptidase